MESVARITRNTKTLIDNVYYNKSVNNIIFGNLSSIISDHLFQFLIEPSGFSEKSSKIINIGTVFALILIQMMFFPIFSKS